MAGEEIMAFTIPEGLHEDLYPLAWLVGTWRGKGRGEYPGITPFQFAHEVTFNHDGRDFLNYYSRTWVIDENNEIISPFDSEVGFWRTKPKNVLEVVLANSNGNGEGWLGIHQGPKIQLAFDKGYASPSGTSIVEGSRLYGLVEGQLFFAFDKGTEDKELQAYLWSTLERQAD